MASMAFIEELLLLLRSTLCTALYLVNRPGGILDNTQGGRHIGTNLGVSLGRTVSNSGLRSLIHSHQDGIAHKLSF